MQTSKLILILATTLPLSHPWAAQEDPEKPPVEVRAEVNPEEYAELHEDRLGFEVYQPQHASPRAILGVIRELTETKIRYAPRRPLGEDDFAYRDRFVEIGNGIGVQDFDVGRRQALQLLTRVDQMLGAQDDDEEATQARQRTVTYTSRGLGPDGIRTLLDELPTSIVFSTIPDSNVTLLTGTQAELDRVLGLLASVDKPAPQFLLTCWLLRSGDAQGADVPEELALGISKLLPGSTYAVIARSVVRSSVSPQATLALETLLSTSASPNIPPPNFRLEATPVAYDTETGSLSLKGCTFDFRSPLTQATVAPNGAAAEHFSGYSTERLVTDLTLSRGEYAVVGALGAEQKLIVLRFEALD